MASLFKAVGATGGVPRTLMARMANNGNFMTLEGPVGTDYQVPAGKTFKVTKIIIATAANGQVILGYGTAAVADGAAAPAGATYLIGTSTPDSPLCSPAANTTYTHDVYAEVPATMYPFVRGGSAGAPFYVCVIGIEE